MRISHLELIEKFRLPDARLGRQQTELNLAPLLYSGGSKIDVRYVVENIRNNKLGKPVAGRLDLVTGLHQELLVMIAEGVSSLTLRSKVRKLKDLFSWCDNTGKVITTTTAVECLINWSEALNSRVYRKEILSITANGMLSTITPLFEAVLGLHSPLCTKLKTKKERRRKSSSKDNHNLEKAYEFGHFLYDITQSLSIERIYGTLPLTVDLRTGASFDEWSGLPPESKVKALTYKVSNPAKYRATFNTRAAYIADHSPRTRSPLINLRMEAEMLIFISETALPLQSVFRLPYSSFSYKSVTGGYELRRIYKDRAKSELIGNVHKEYRAHFNEYLTWRESIFGNDADSLLFPFITAPGKSEVLAPLFHAVNKRSKQLGVQMFGPRQLKTVKLNFFLRETKNPEITAEHGQHSLGTFFRSYNQPSAQIAFIEISNFHSKHSPFLFPPGPGVCLRAQPERIPVYDASAHLIPMSDCMSPSGCLFCKQNKDLEEFDHIWSLFSFRQLKIIELSRGAPVDITKQITPSLAVVNRITEKLDAIAATSTSGEVWISEARQRIAEGDYHPKWRGFIKLTELSSL